MNPEEANLARLRQAARNLLPQASLTPGETAERLSKARSETYWQNLVPKLHLNARSSLAKGFEAAGVNGVADVKALVDLQGYLYRENVFCPDVVGFMRAGAEKLRQEGWPPVFAYVYDEFWQITRSATPRALLEALLGRGYRQVPHIWVFHIEAKRGARGWPPHVDSDGRNDRPGRFTIWIPLTDATLDNGCIYLVPRDLAAGLDKVLGAQQSLSSEQVSRLLQSSRALPAVAGSILGWGFDVLHWGSTALGTGAARISLSTEFIGPDQEPSGDECPVLDLSGELPAFEERLQVISRALLSYARFDPLAAARFGALARELSK